MSAPGVRAIPVLTSVVIPTRDRADLLTTTLRSVLAQRDVDLQIIIVDDGSTDGTPERFERVDARVTIVRHDAPQGVGAARNAGIEVADGEWIAFLDDDDLWAPDKLSRQIRSALEQNAVWACSGSVTFEGDGRIIAGEPPPSSDAIASALPFRNCVPSGASNVVARVDALRAAGRFDTVLRHIADWDMWMRLGQLGAPAVVALPSVAYRQHAGNASGDASIMRDEMARIEARSSALRGGRQIDRAAVYRWSAWHLLRAGRRGDAVRAYGWAVAAGDVASMGRAAVAVIAPGIVHRRSRRFGADPEWIAAAEEWLQTALSENR